MIFQDNVIKEYLRNVYFISGTPCAGKTTITRALGKKYGIPVYVIDDQFTLSFLQELCCETLLRFRDAYICEHRVRFQYLNQRDIKSLS